MFNSMHQQNGYANHSVDPTAVLRQQIHQQMVHVIQENATLSPGRRALAEQASQNNWNNPVISELIKNAYDYADMLIRGQGMPPQQAVSTSVGFCHDAMVALTCRNTPGLFNSMTYEQQNQINQKLIQVEQIGTAVRTFAQQSAGHMAQPYMQRPSPQAMQYQQPQQMYNMPPAQHMGYNQPQMHPGHQSQYMQPQPPVNSPYANTHSAHRNVVAPLPPPVSTFGVPSPYANTQLQPQPTPQVTVMAQPSVTPQPTEVQQIKGCNISLKWTAKCPWVSVFDTANTVALFIPDTTGGYTDKYVTRGNNVEYKDHVYEQFFTNLTMSDSNKLKSVTGFETAVENSQQMTRISDLLKRLDESPDGESDIDIPAQAAYDIDCRFYCTGSNYHNTANSGLEGLGFQNMSVTDTFIRYVHVSYLDWSMYDDAAEMGLKLEKVKTYQEMKRIMLLMKDCLPEYNWRVLNDRVTAHVNTIARVNLGFSFTMDAFCTDIDDLQSAILDTYKSSGLDLFNQSVDMVTSTTLRIHSGEVYTSGFETVPEKEPVGYGDVICVNLLPVHSSTVSIGMYGDVGVVMQSKFPKFYKALETTFDTLPEDCGFVKFVTSDGGVINAHKSLIGGSYLITR